MQRTIMQPYTGLFALQRFCMLYDEATLSSRVSRNGLPYFDDYAITVRTITANGSLGDLLLSLPVSGRYFSLVCYASAAAKARIRIGSKEAATLADYRIYRGSFRVDKDIRDRKISLEFNALMPGKCHMYSIFLESRFFSPSAGERVTFAQNVTREKCFRLLENLR